jgi:hypothetical protein
MEDLVLANALLWHSALASLSLDEAHSRESSLSGVAGCVPSVGCRYVLRSGDDDLSVTQIEAHFDNAGDGFVRPSFRPWLMTLGKDFSRGFPDRQATRQRTSCAGANQVNDLVGGRQPASLLFGIDSVAVNENIQRPRPAHANASGNLQFAFDALFQAHGLRLDVTSKETALDFHGHSGLLPRYYHAPIRDEGALMSSESSYRHHVE